jgi:hypothetical protein
MGNGRWLMVSSYQLSVNSYQCIGFRVQRTGYKCIRLWPRFKIADSTLVQRHGEEEMRSVSTKRRVGVEYAEKWIMSLVHWGIIILHSALYNHKWGNRLRVLAEL